MRLFFILFFTVIAFEVSANKSKSEILHAEKSFISSTRERNQLLSGGHWVRKVSSYKLETPYGEIQSLNGDFYVNYEASRVSVANHMGELTVVLRDGGVVEVPPGFEFWFSEVDISKKNLMGFIEPIDLKDHILNLGKLWPQDQQKFKSELLKFQNRWGDRANLAAQYYKGLAERKIASVQKREAHIRSLKRREQSRREANRKLLFERAFSR